MCLSVRVASNTHSKMYIKASPALTRVHGWDTHSTPAWWLPRGRSGFPSPWWRAGTQRPWGRRQRRWWKGSWRPALPWAHLWTQGEESKGVRPTSPWQAGRFPNHIKHQHRIQYLHRYLHWHMTGSHRSYHWCSFSRDLLILLHNLKPSRPETRRKKTTLFKNWPHALKKEMANKLVSGQNLNQDTLFCHKYG